MSRSLVRLLGALLTLLALPSEPSEARPTAREITWVAAAANPAVATIDLETFTSVTIQVTAPSGAHTVAVQTRPCSSTQSCEWHTETSLACSFTGGAGQCQISVTFPVTAVRLSVTNARLVQMGGWFLRAGDER